MRAIPKMDGLLNEYRVIKRMIFFNVLYNFLNNNNQIVFLKILSELFIISINYFIILKCHSYFYINNINRV